MIRIIADDNIPYLKGALEPYAAVSYKDGRLVGRNDLMAADALIVGTRTKCTRDLLEGTPVRFIATATIGFDHIDTDFCREKGIAWANAPGCNSGSVQQYLASVFAHLSARKGHSLKDKTAGIIGAGNVGKKVETLCRLLGMKVLLNDPPRARKEGDAGFVSLPFLLQESDFVTLHVPLNRTGPDKTENLIGKDEIGLMKPGSWLINTARGDVLDEGALKKALNTGHLAGTVIDVWRDEPDPDSGLIPLAEIATPHIAGYSADGKRNAAVMVLKAAAGFFRLPFGEFRIPPLPEPQNREIQVPQHLHENEHQIFSAILQTYDVLADDHLFRSAPGRFEWLRNHYPVRREFRAYQWKESDLSPMIRETWSRLSL